MGFEAYFPLFSLYLTLFCSFCTIKWAATWQNQQSECAHSEDSDQPGHPPSLIRLFAVRMMKPWVLGYPLSAQWRLIRLGGCPGWSESLLQAHSFCWSSGVVARSEACSLGMQAAPSSIPMSGTFFRGDLVMKTFLWPFSLFHWFKKSSCLLLAKEYAQSTGELPRRLPQ